MSLSEVVQKALMAGLGMQEKAKEFVDELVKKGELSEMQGAKLIKEWSEKASASKDEFDKSIKDLVNKAVEMINFPTRKEFDELNKKVESLAETVKHLEK
ncbi:MAG: phasin family protein [Nitrospirae bacterium]|nr:phasin family protein [Nitrospirota bacterium]